MYGPIDNKDKMAFGIVDTPYSKACEKSTSTSSTISVERNASSYLVDIVKTFEKHKGPNEFVTFHGPDTHNHEPLHSQFTLVNSLTKNAFKIKILEDE